MSVSRRLSFSFDSDWKAVINEVTFYRSLSYFYSNYYSSLESWRGTGLLFTISYSSYWCYPLTIMAFYTKIWELSGPRLNEIKNVMFKMLNKP